MVFLNIVLSEIISLVSGMTALETWCLAMIGLVFEALLAYVIVLVALFRENALQV